MATKKPNRTMIVTNVTLTPVLAAAIRAESQETKKTVSQIVRELLRARYINAQEQQR
jgi:hypothetical protein